MHKGCETLLTTSDASAARHVYSSSTNLLLFRLNADFAGVHHS